MLAVTRYTKDYVDSVRASVGADTAAFEALASPNGFEPVFFNNLVIVLDRRFGHRARGQEGKDGNPLNEVRVIADSLIENGGEFTPNKTIKMKPESTVLGYVAGDTIALSKADFVRLSDAFLAEIGTRFPG